MSARKRRPRLEELFHRIKWDPAFGKGRFAVGYWDRVSGTECIVPFSAIVIEPQRPGMFAVHDESGFVVHIPLHRVRTVYKDGVAIWKRRERPPSAAERTRPGPD